MFLAPLPNLPPAIVCQAPRAIDGDTLACSNLPRRVRLAGIDAPELPGHCRRGRVCAPGDPWRSRALLARFVVSGRALVHPAGADRYGRILARVTVGRFDASCTMLAARAAVRRYARVRC